MFSATNQQQLFLATIRDSELHRDLLALHERLGVAQALATPSPAQRLCHESVFFKFKFSKGRAAGALALQQLELQVET